MAEAAVQTAEIVSNLVDLEKAKNAGAKTAIKTSVDLETQLAYVKQTRKEHGYSKAVDKLFGLVLSYINDAEEAFRNGHNAAWMSGGVWSPVYYAAGAIPISINEVGRLGSADAMFVAEDYFQLPKESCSMVGAVLGEFYLRQARTVKRVAVYNASCEPLNLAWELLKDEGFDVFRFESVNRPNAHDDPERVKLMEDFFIQELKDLSVWINGKPVDETKLAYEQKRANRIFAKVRRILDLRNENPFYIRSLATVYLLIGTGHYFGKPEEYETVLDLLIDEMEKADKVPSPTGKTVRLAWVGGRGQEFGVYQAVDDAGGAITQWHTPDEWNKSYNENLPPLEAYADYVLSARVDHNPFRRLKRIEEYIPKYGAQGLLFYGYVGCSFSGIYKEIQRDYFQKRGLASISLEGSFQVGPPSGQLLTRVRAFVEMFP